MERYLRTIDCERAVVPIAEASAAIHRRCLKQMHPRAWFYHLDVVAPPRAQDTSREGPHDIDGWLGQKRSPLLQWLHNFYIRG